MQTEVGSVHRNRNLAHHHYNHHHGGCGGGGCCKVVSFDASTPASFGGSCLNFFFAGSSAAMSKLSKIMSRLVGVEVVELAV